MAPIKTWMGEAFFAFHHINAFEQNGDLVFDIAAYNDATLIDAFYLERLRAGRTHPNVAIPALPAANEQLKRRLRSPGGRGDRIAACELQPQQCERLSLCLWRQQPTDRPGDLYNQLVKVDVCQRTAKVWLAEDCYVGEPVFVAAPEAATEDDGVILSVVFNAAAGTSFLLVLDAHSFLEIAQAWKCRITFPSAFMASILRIEIISESFPGPPRSLFPVHSLAYPPQRHIKRFTSPPRRRIILVTPGEYAARTLIETEVAGWKPPQQKAAECRLENLPKKGLWPSRPAREGPLQPGPVLAGRRVQPFGLN